MSTSLDIEIPTKVNVSPDRNQTFHFSLRETTFKLNVPYHEKVIMLKQDSITLFQN